MDQHIASANGEPFDTREHALEYARQHELDARPVKVRGAWLLERTAPEPARPIDRPPSATAPEPPPAPEYYWATFAAKAGSNETDDVQLCVNGDWKIIQREARVCVPAAYINAARDARRVQYRVVAGEANKRLVHIQEYPFRLEGPASAEEYRAFLATVEPKPVPA